MKLQSMPRHRRWLSRHSRTICLIGALTFFVPSVQAQADELQEGDRVMKTLAVGYVPEGDFVLRCPSNRQVAGFVIMTLNGRPGDGVTEIDLICATALAPAVAGSFERYSKGSFGASINVPLSTSGVPGMVTLACPKELPAVTKLKIEVEQEVGGSGQWDFHDAPHSVNGIGLHCSLVDRPQNRHVQGPAYWGRLRAEERVIDYYDTQIRRWTHKYVTFENPKAAEVREGTIWGNSTCADQLVAVGISGKSLALRVYSLGLICGYPVITQGPEPTVKAQRRIPLPPGTTSGLSNLSICEKARWARARNSPAAPGLEAQCAREQGAATDGSRPGDTVGQPLPPGPDSGRMEYPRPVKVLLEVDVYDAAGGIDPKRGTLIANTQGVTLAEPCKDYWCHVNWPAGNGWVYSGPGYQSLDVQ